MRLQASLLTVVLLLGVPVSWAQEAPAQEPSTPAASSSPATAAPSKAPTQRPSASVSGPQGATVVPPLPEPPLSDVPDPRPSLPVDPGLADSSRPSSTGPGGSPVALLLSLAAIVGLALNILLGRSRLEAFNERATRLKERVAELAARCDELAVRPPVASAPAPTEHARPVAPASVVAPQPPDHGPEVRALTERLVNLERALKEAEGRWQEAQRRAAAAGPPPAAPAAPSQPTPALAVAAPAASAVASEDVLSGLALSLARLLSAGSSTLPDASLSDATVMSRLAGPATRLASLLAQSDRSLPPDLGTLVTPFIRRFAVGDTMSAGAPPAREFLRHAPAEVVARPSRFLVGYLDWAAKPGGAPRSEVEPSADDLAVLVDDIHEARSRVHSRRLAGNDTAYLASLAGGLDSAFDTIRDLLRDRDMALIAPAVGLPPDPATCRVAQTAPSTEVPSGTVSRVIRCGLKDPATGRVLRPAEVILAA